MAQQHKADGDGAHTIELGNLSVCAWGLHQYKLEWCRAHLTKWLAHGNPMPVPGDHLTVMLLSATAVVMLLHRLNDALAPRRIQSLPSRLTA
jgi:hypothetical protein